VFPCAFTQSNEKPKLKDFGSSLKRFKWDPKRNAAVEGKNGARKNKDDGDDDVVRVETSLVTSDVLVLDALGDPVAGLTDKDFLLAEDGKPQHVGMFSLGDSVTVPR